MVRIGNYSKSYNHRLVLQVPALELETDIYWLKGENGSGKTTFLKSVAGLLPFEGTIAVQDVSIKQQPINYRQLVSYAEAEPLYPAFLTGNDLLEFYRQTRKADSSQINTLADALGVSNYSQHKIGTYSSGMAKKLSLVLAFTGAPKLILLDEPFITLDVNAQRILTNLIADSAQRGTTFIISSHQPFDVLQPTTLTVASQTITPQAALC
ncbi:ABC transporter ATP-binding protein [Pontibacter sp. Tf4]|uniref:ABC transporter ATP-binding protein n=1 Tax=Pontibacter sp. Tf4 TaxID=2761620 RepID=UPI001625F77C|nr:ABC transporter ATP-binding protein [Pontibacter sp. Tf4]MBB6610902.1 ABC transporter ATP-binding protein [Pontibacter sp. Tf4]